MSNPIPKVNESEDGSVTFDEDFVKTMQLYRVDWDFDIEDENGESHLQHAYTFIVIEPNRIREVSENWSPEAQNLTFRHVSRTLEEEAYRAGLQEGYETAIRDLRESGVEVEVHDESQPTLFD